jgi:hypothetical protein
MMRTMTKKMMTKTMMTMIFWTISVLIGDPQYQSIMDLAEMIVRRSLGTVSSLEHPTTAMMSQILTVP